MAVTWRLELMFECNKCSVQLCLDQLQAPTKREMFIVAQHIGWIWNGNQCLCPECKPDKKISGKVSFLIKPSN